MKITKAIIAAAGLGTRFLPATKAVPKEMLPLLDRPILQHVVEEAVSSGITDVILVIRRGSHAITDHFDSAPELERTLEATGKLRLLEEVRHVSQLANFAFVRQGNDLPYGNGTPLLAASPFISKGEIFCYMFGDDVIDADPPGLRQVMDAYERYQPAGVMAAYKVPWLNYEKRLSPVLSNNPGYLRSVGIGAAFALGWTPCIGPILGAILTLAWSSQTVGQGAFLLAIYSLGLGIPFIIIGLVWGTITPLWKGINRHLGTISIISGALLIIVGILMLTGNLAWLSQFA